MAKKTAKAGGELTARDTDEMLRVFDAMNRLERLLPGAPGAPPAMMAAGLGADLCGQYAQIRPYIEPLLEFVEWLPHGAKIAKIVRTLARVADALCAPAGAPTARVAGAAKLAAAPRAVDVSSRFMGAFEALDEIDKRLPGGATMAAAVSGEDFCKYYRQVEPLLDAVLPYVEWLPYGATISKVIRLLMRIAEAYCGS